MTSVSSSSASSSSAKVSPILVKDMLQMTSLGISADVIKFKNVFLQSNNYICVREEDKKGVAIIDTSSKAVTRYSVPVDSALMNPVSKVVAFRSGNNLQIFNMEMKTMMKKTVLNNPMFWRWLDAKTIAIVTDSAVYHWSMEGDTQPEKIFDRPAYTDGPVQVLNYRASADLKWLLLGGIAANKTGGVSGVLSVYSVDNKAAQPTMDSHAACFMNLTLANREKSSNLFAFTMKLGDDTLKVNLLEVGVPKEQTFSQSIACRLSDKDFPVALLPDNKHGCLWLLSRDGVVIIMEIQSGKVLLTTQVATSIVFATCEHADNGIVSIDQSGRVVHYQIDDKNIINYVTSVMHDVELAVKMAQWYDLEGVTHIFKQHFDQLMSSQRFDAAMDLAVTSPKGCLRTAETIQAIKQASSLTNAPALIQYFHAIIKRTSLNKIESIELVRFILSQRSATQQQAVEKITELIKEQKLEPSEELGDSLRTANIQLALSVYLRAKVPEKVISCFLTLAATETNATTAEGHLNNIMEYSKRVSFTPDYPLLVGQLTRANSERGLQLALILLKNSDFKCDINQMVNTFMASNDVKSTTAILLEYLKPRGDKEEDAALQTKLLEINLLSNPTFADTLLDTEQNKFTHYDRLKIAQLCENAQLYQRALEHYTELSDIKRVLANTHALNPEFLLEYFGHMTPENCLDCLRDLLKYNLQSNIRLVVEVAKKWNDYLTPTALISLFEEFKSYNGLFYYLGNFVNTTTDAKIIFKYIEAATKLQQYREVERVCRDNDHYDGKETRDFLISQNLKDPRALIYVCDKFNFVPELTQYLYNQNTLNFLEAYVSRMNAKSTPAVVGTLLDLNANEDWIKTKLLAPVRPPTDDKDFVTRLVTECEKRNRLKILRTWLEARAGENSEDVAVHNGLAKIYVEINNSPQQFLTNNKFYDSKVVGAYCESRDPHLAFLAYKRANGECDKELIAVTNKNGFFKDQARYMVERRDENLWASVLSEQNEFRRQLIDQVVATALPESRVADEISVAVRAFMAANLPNELIELLERIILHGPSEGEFHSNKNLQNLLILTAIKADSKRVMEYVKRLDNYDGPDIAKIACSDQYKLYEEAFFIYKKFNKGEESISVLLDNLKDMDKAVEFAQYTDQPPVWSLLAKAQLEAKKVKESIASFLRANDATCFEGVLTAGKAQSLFAELIPFISMARQKIKEPMVDNELIYCYARTNKLAEMEDFLATPSKAQFQTVGDMLFDEKMFQAARILYSHVNNYAKLAICLVRLALFQEAVDASRKANNINTWKDVCYACVDAKHFRLASVCGVNIIVFHEHLMDLCKYYEMAGHHEELILLLEQGLLLDRTHQGIFTQLAVMYSKYKEDKLFEHIKLFITRLNIPTVLAICQKNLQWSECVFLYTHYDQFDNAIDIMIEHSPVAWEHKQFKEVLSHVPNTEIYYKAIEFYLLEHPLLVNDLLLELASKLDHGRVVNMLRSVKHMPLAEKYLLFVQRENINAVNEAVNELYFNEEKYKQLRESIDGFDKFDQIALAQKCETHQLLEFRRIAAYLYKLNKRWERSIELSQKDRQWLDASETAAQSKSMDLAEKLLYYFVDCGEYECFAACLFTCYELIRPDVVIELAWRKNLSDYAMPYLIQVMRHWSDKFVALQDKVDEHEKSLHAVEQKQEEKKDQSHVGVSMAPSPYLALPSPQMVYNGPSSIPMNTNMVSGLPPLPNQFGGMM